MFQLSLNLIAQNFEIKLEQNDHGWTNSLIYYRWLNIISKLFVDSALHNYPVILLGL